MPIRHFAAVTLSLAVALGVAGCSGEEPQTVPGTPGPTSSDPVIQPGLPGEPNATLSGSVAATAGPKPTVVAGDVSFYRDMIVHHAQAIVMVETAMPRLVDPQVKALASRIADEQNPEILYMSTWLRDRSQEVPPQATNPRLGDHEHDDMPGMTHDETSGMDPDSATTSTTGCRAWPRRPSSPSLPRRRVSRPTASSSPS